MKLLPLLFLLSCAPTPPPEVCAYIGDHLMCANEGKIIEYKVVYVIESCSSSGRCRVLFDDGSTDLIFNPQLGMRVSKKQRPN